MNARTVKTTPPVRLIIGLILLGLLLLSAIGFAVYSSQNQIVKARMRGVVVERYFRPDPEQQITIGKDGLRTENTPGKFIIIVEVPKHDGSQHAYTVFLSEDDYNHIQIGDTFDVGPYLVRP